MSRHLAAAVFSMAFAAAIAGEAVRTTEVAGVRLDVTSNVDGVELVLNGAGLRQRFGLDVYVIGLYVSDKTASAQAALESQGPKRIALTFLREVSAQSLVDALYEGLRDNSNAVEFERLRVSAERLSAIMLPLKLARKGDVVALDYLPDAGAQVLVNGRPVGRLVPDPEFYRALLKIWLGDSPVDAGLKRALLSGRS
jgi:hypothetical protein